MERVKSREVYSDGMAIAVYDINSGTQTFRFNDEELTVPLFSVPQGKYKGWDCVAKWEDVKRAHSQVQ